MASFNKVILVGNLTRDPEMAHTASNTAICKFGLAINHRWRDQSGETREEVCFVDCTCFGRRGEVINQYMSKGRPILVEGRLRYDRWEDQNGNKRSKHEVVVDNFTFLGGGGEQRGGGSSRQMASPASAGAPPQMDDYGPPPDGDVPF